MFAVKVYLTSHNNTQPPGHNTNIRQTMKNVLENVKTYL